MHRFARFTFLASVAFGISLGSAAHASSELGVDFTSAGALGGSSVWNLGYEFVANSNVTVSGLGSWAGFTTAQDQQVGLWDARGTLLASAFVSASSPSVGSGGWKFTAISPLALTAGETYIVGSQGGWGYTWSTGGFATSPSITFVKDRWIYLGTDANDPLAFPTLTDNLQGFFGGNILIGDGAVPEPASWAMMIAGLGAAGMMMRRRQNVAISFA